MKILQILFNRIHPICRPNLTTSEQSLLHLAPSALATVPEYLPACLHSSGNGAISMSELAGNSN